MAGKFKMPSIKDVEQEENKDVVVKENFRKSWESSIVISNIKIENKKIYMNDNTYIGRDKDKILKNLRNDYNAEIIEI